MRHADTVFLLVAASFIGFTVLTFMRPFRSRAHGCVPASDHPELQLRACAAPWQTLTMIGPSWRSVRIVRRRRHDRRRVHCDERLLCHGAPLPFVPMWPTLWRSTQLRLTASCACSRHVGQKAHKTASQAALCTRRRATRASRTSRSPTLRTRSGPYTTRATLVRRPSVLI